jgi:hypothetical protein
VRVMQAPLVELERERELEEFQRLRAAARRGEGAALSFRSTTAFFGLLALGDRPLALDAILELPPAPGRTHWRLLTNCGAA